MTENELLEDFLSHGNGYYPEDKKRFLRWAIAAHQAGAEFPFRIFEYRLTPPAARYYQVAFDFVGLTLQALSAQ